MDTSKLGTWPLITLPYYGEISWSESVAELHNRGLSSRLAKLLHILVFPLVAYSRTLDDYMLVDRPPDLADCLWSLGTFSALVGLGSMPFVALFFKDFSLLPAVLLVGCLVLKIISLPFTRRVK